MWLKTKVPTIGSFELDKIEAVLKRTYNLCFEQKYENSVLTLYIPALLYYSRARVLRGPRLHGRISVMQSVTVISPIVLFQVPPTKPNWEQTKEHKDKNT